eukprot:g8932.t1
MTSNLLWFVFALLSAFGILVQAVRRSVNKLKSRSDAPIPVWECTAHGPYSITGAVSMRRFDRKPKGPFLSIVIPCYNEELRVLDTLESTVRYFDEWCQDLSDPVTYELIIVDDGSTDDTINVVFDFARHLKIESKTRVLKLHKNSGKGAAVKEGVLRSTGALCLVMDADGATDIEEFNSLYMRLVEHSLTSGATGQTPAQIISKSTAVIVGSRAHLQAESVAKRSLYRTILMHGFHLCVWIVTRTPIKDTQCGFKLFTRDAVGYIFPYLKLQRWCFDVEVLLLATKQSIAVFEVPVRWQEIPGSKVKFYHILHMLWELFMIFVGYNFYHSWNEMRARKP